MVKALLSSFIVGLMLLFSGVPECKADTIDMHIEWTYNGSETLGVEGFKLYRLEDDNPLFDKQLVATMEGKDTRAWEGDIYADNGINRYVMTAYGTGGESPQSPGYRFEYQDVNVSWETEIPGIFILRLIKGR